MFCPRCGRAVSETSNFCGGCGLSRTEIEKYIVKTEAPKAEAEPRTVHWESAPAQEMPKAEPVKTETAEAVKAGPAAEAAKAEAAPNFAEAEIIADAAKETEEAKARQSAEESTSKTYNSAYEYRYTAENIRQDNATDTQQTSAENANGYSGETAQPKTEPQQTQPEFSYVPPVKEVKNENLSTVDFLWMMIIAGIPVAGLVYLIYLALQNDNTNKRSYARASLIISVFASVISIVFIIGFMLSGI